MRRASKRRKTGQPCPYCKHQMQRQHPKHRPTRDHKIPEARGGTDDFRNIEIICYTCNQEKASLLPEEFIAWREGRASRMDKGFRWRINQYAYEQFRKGFYLE